VAFAVHCLKATRDDPSGAPLTDQRPQDERGRGGLLACSACGQAITTAAARIHVGGSHEHRFTNPHGFQFHIGCFSEAPGCAVAGEPSTFFTWFPGHSWQVEGCSRCDAHLGWLFRSAGHGFHGLVLGRLVEREAGA
jgi:hypothetical protein